LTANCRPANASQPITFSSLSTLNASTLSGSASSSSSSPCYRNMTT
jgi:hypothetical protein